MLQLATNTNKKHSPGMENVIEIGFLCLWKRPPQLGFPFPFRIRFPLSLITAIFHRIYAHASLTFWPSANAANIANACSAWKCLLIARFIANFRHIWWAGGGEIEHKLCYCSSKILLPRFPSGGLDFWGILCGFSMEEVMLQWINGCNMS